MLTYQCKCCGAALSIKPNIKICKCTYCDVMQTVPLLDYDEKAVLWARADNLRRSGEYDRAADVYEQLTMLDDREPDVFWSKMLCRYGVEYVEENGSRQRTPTLNRIQYKPVIDDEDYRAALKLSDGDQHRLYVVQAMKLEELRKEILSVSMTAQPYDIFICYKETDASGRRTDDSVLAGQLYRALTAEGWRVFFARTSLEDKAGTEYEPYIFAALNSAKLMLAVGTSPENFNAVWVKNEWNRYLYRISERNEGNLVVLYKNMLPQHLPEEFAHLQSFDMGVPDFMEELLRGTRKLLSSPRQTITAQTAEDANIVEAATAASLLRRAELCLEDGEFDRADEFCELALNCEPENADIYFTKLLAEYRIKNQDELTRVMADFSQSGNYKKAMRFGDEQLCERLSEAHRQALYNRYCIELENAAYESQCDGIAARFAALGNYLDSPTKAEECRQKAKCLAEERILAVNERKYSESKRKLDDIYNDIAALSTAEKQFRELGDYKDSVSLADKCAEKIKALTVQKEKELAESALIEEKKRKEAEKFGRILKKVLFIGVPAAAVIIVGGILVNQISLSTRYDNAVALCEDGKYDDAITQFAELSDYKDSFEQIMYTRYLKAVSLFESNQYTEASDIFERLGSYRDSKDMLLKAKYCLADEAAVNGRYDEAVSRFTALGDYSDSAERVMALKYDHAVSIRDSEDFSTAADEFEVLGEYSDCQEQTIACRYAYAQQLFDNKEFELAAEAFERLGNYSDSAEKVILVKYSAAGHYAENGDYQNACMLYEELGDYSDCQIRLLEVQYDYAAYLAESRDYEKAIRYYRELSKKQYSDCPEKLVQVTYDQAIYYADNNRFSEAIDILLSIEQDKSQDILKEVRYKYAVYLSAEEQYEQALQQLAFIEDYKNTPEMNQKVKYDWACDLYKKGSYDKAYELFSALGNYSDSASMLKQTDKQIFCSSVRGDIITFGSYEQNGIFNDGAEPIEWIVLDRQDNKILVLSKYCLERDEFGASTWENSTIRVWLNDDFISTSFTAEEKARICLTTLENNSNTLYNTYGGASTEDKVFLLSDEEVKQYMSEYDERITTRTRYSYQKYYDHCMQIPNLLNPPEPDEDAVWWLRSVGDQLCIDYVAAWSISNSGVDYDLSRDIRPAMWIDVSE